LEPPSLCGMSQGGWSAACLISAGLGLLALVIFAMSSTTRFLMGGKSMLGRELLRP
jgi:hypothetical protein